MWNWWQKQQWASLSRRAGSSMSDLHALYTNPSQLPLRVEFECVDQLSHALHTACLYRSSWMFDAIICQQEGTGVQGMVKSQMSSDSTVRRACTEKQKLPHDASWENTSPFQQVLIHTRSALLLKAGNVKLRKERKRFDYLHHRICFLWYPVPHAASQWNLVLGQDKNIQFVSWCVLKGDLYCSKVTQLLSADGSVQHWLISNMINGIVCFQIKCLSSFISVIITLHCFF